MTGVQTCALPIYRRFSLPDSADAEHIEAIGKNGVLEIILPKHADVQPRKISVKN